MLKIDGKSLTIEEFTAVVEGKEKVSLSPQARKDIVINRNYLEKKLEEGGIFYGINTGFGYLSNCPISSDQAEELQRNLILSHAAGFGDLLEKNIVRGILLLRANSLAKGYSGVRPEVVETIIELLNKNIIPCIPSQGSVGASGDLAPLSHMSLAIIGEGQVDYKGKIVKSSYALESEGIKPLVLKEKEGLALINGTQVMSSLGLVNLVKGWNNLENATLIAALTWEGLQGLGNAFHPLISKVRPHPGQEKIAKLMLYYLQGSGNLKEIREDKVQDAYSLRCIPQVHGASWEALKHLEEILNREINSSTDNPLIFHQEDKILSGGNFHGQILAIPLDYAAMALAEIGNISERRVERMVNPSLSGLSPFLVEDCGLNSGYMVIQYTAAALVSENKVFANPASTDSIPTSANQEDHVSMGTISARKLTRINENLTGILAAEALCACQAIDLGKGPHLGKITEKIYRLIRSYVPFLTHDRFLHEELKIVAKLIRDGELLKVLRKRSE